MELLPAAPDNAVAIVIAAPPLVLMGVVPEMVLSRYDVDPTGSGVSLVGKSAGLRPPAAVIVPASAVELACVFGWVGRFAAY